MTKEDSMMTPTDIVIACEYKNLKLLLEVHDLFVCAYVKENDVIKGDVWIFNIGESKGEIPWKLKGAKPPFYNPAEYIKENKMFTLSDLGKITVTYNTHNDKFQIYHSGFLISMVGVGDKPGYSTLVSKKGPLAIPL